MTRARFLRWALVNVAFLSALVAGAIAYDGPLHSSAKIGSALVLAVFVNASARIGAAAYTENITPALLEDLREDAQLCPKVAMAGTLCGLIVVLQSLADTASPDRLAGAAAVFICTLFGVVCMVVLERLARWLRASA